MSAPRPSEADVEALAKVLEVHDWRWDTRNSVTGDGVRIACTGPKCEWFADRNDDLDRDIWAEHRAHVAAVLSVLLAARDAEHERDVVGAAAIGRVLDLDGQVQQARLRAEAAERALADRDAAIKAVREFCEEHQRQWNPGMEKAQQFTFDGGVGAAAQDVLALLSRDDTAGAGGAE